MDRATQRNLPYYERNLLLETRKVLIGWTQSFLALWLDITVLKLLMKITFARVVAQPYADM